LPLLLKPSIQSLINTLPFEIFQRLIAVRRLRCVMAAVVIAAPVTLARAQAVAAPAAAPPPEAAPEPAPSVSLQALLGLGDAWSVSTQVTFIEQGNSSFPAAYSGQNSFGPGSESEHTFSYSLFFGRKLWDNDTELFYDPEFFQGYGLSSTFGIAGFPNGEAVKAGFPNLHYNTSRLFIRHVFGFGGDKEKLDADQRQFADQEDVNRLVLSVGKVSANDFFDDNAYSHDPRSQFMNWALWESAAWDYPADIVGFIPGAVAEWNTANMTLHVGLFMEAKVANGLRLDYHINRAHGEIVQYDYRYERGKRHGTIRTFVYSNQARMGSYAEAAQQPYPEAIIPTRAYRSKTGFGSSWDQELTGDLGAFARLSWNDGTSESFNFTEVDRSLATGLSLKGSLWGRGSDTVGLAGVVNGISSDHRHYLEEGGNGLILGDGALSYRPEETLETYYAFQPWTWIQLSPDYQYIRNPGYNSARGPVSVFAIRAHLQF